ncbi:MAG TPA: glycerophosphoryl diester phosphodiesterase membrane domain-containing protein [Acidisarcina sp.]
MNTELRPRTLGEILDGTAQLYRSHFLLFVGIAVFPRALLLVTQLLQIGVDHVLELRHLPTLWFTVGASGISLLLYFAFVGLGLAASNRAVSALYLGQTATIAESYQEVKPHWIRYLGIMFLAALYSWGPTMIPYAGIFAVIGIDGKKFMPGTGVTAGPGTFAGLAVLGVAGLAMLVTVPFGIWMSLRYAVAVPASIFENAGVAASLKRSVYLTKKGRGRIFVMVLMIGIIFWVIAAVTEMPFVLQAFKAAKNHQQPPVISLVLSQIVSFFLYSVIGPIYGIAITLFYYDERIRKEGFDIEFMMQQANLSGGEPAIEPPTQLEPGLS